MTPGLLLRSVGLTADGRLALRDPAAVHLKPLVDAENMDRDILYASSAAEAGHGSNDQYGDWIPYERETCAREWLAQAPALWWHRDERGNWMRKSEPQAPAEKHLK